LAFDIDRSLRRLKPGKRTARLAYRPPSALPFVEAAMPPARNLLLDTTVYVHAGEGRLAPPTQAFVAASQAHHCIVCLGELALALGYLDPRHPGTPAASSYLADVLRRAPPHRIVAPDDDACIEASIATGILSRTQNVAAANRRRLLNDALIGATALKNGLVVLTANVADFDLLSQLQPATRVLYYVPM
jgi:predicted nucleic acid-binding protein